MLYVIGEILRTAFVAQLERGSNKPKVVSSILIEGMILSW